MFVFIGGIYANLVRGIKVNGQPLFAGLRVDANVLSKSSIRALKWHVPQEYRYPTHRAGRNFGTLLKDKTCTCRLLYTIRVYAVLYKAIETGSNIAH